MIGKSVGDTSHWWRGTGRRSCRVGYDARRRSGKGWDVHGCLVRVVDEGRGGGGDSDTASEILGKGVVGVGAIVVITEAF